MPDAPRPQHDAIARGQEQARNEPSVVASLGRAFVQHAILAVGAGIIAVHQYRKDGHWVAAALVAVGVLGVLVRMIWLAVADLRVRRERSMRRSTARAGKRSRRLERRRDEH